MHAVLLFMTGCMVHFDKSVLSSSVSTSNTGPSIDGSVGRMSSNPNNYDLFFCLCMYMCGLVLVLTEHGIDCIVLYVAE